MSTYAHYPMPAGTDPAPRPSSYPGPYQVASAPGPASPAFFGATLGQPGYGTPATSSYLELGRLGATVGLCGAAADNLRRVQNGEIVGTEAVFDSLRTGVAAGLATAAAGYVANQFRSPTTSLAATLIAGTAAMYFLNTKSESQPTGSQPEGDEP